jgi:hypothetical protein
MITAACHVHSDWSYDGKWTLPELAAQFGGKGYRVVMITEHDRGFTEARRLDHRAACAAASSEKALLLPGIEYSDDANRMHVLVWGNIPFLGEGLPTARLLQQVHAAKGIAVLAHPSRMQAWKHFDRKWADTLLGVEVWNRKTDGWAPSKTALPLLEGTRLLSFVGMDFHGIRQMFPLAMELDVREGVSEESVLACLRARRCRPMAFGRPLAEATSGLAGARRNVAESGRRTLAKIYRAFKKSLPS